MCLGVPARVLGPAEGPEGLVRVDVRGVERTANALMLDEPLAPGTWVVLHLGFVMEVIDEAVLGADDLGPTGQAL